MTLFLSRPFEELPAVHAVHTVIVGSGYGAAMAALALAMRQKKTYANSDILVLERGNEFVPGDFPKTTSDLPAHLSFAANGKNRTGYADALFDVRVGENVNAIVGSGLGGTSLINAGVAVDPDEEVFRPWPPAPGGGPWMQEIADSLRFVRQLLGVGKHPRGSGLEKVDALKSVAKALERKDFCAKHELADIAVNFSAKPNAVGVTQAECSDCGNCFTGCNIGAKSTLAMNAWPLANGLGVRIVTGASVSMIVQGAAGSTHAWAVHVHRTTRSEMTRIVRAHRVILAAGTFGSTEILARSEKAGLALGSRAALGTRFSLNGDGIAFGFGQDKDVNACARVPSSVQVEPGAGERPGPTIVSKISLRDKNGQRALVEDATVPQPIARLWAEILATQASLHRFVSSTPSAWHQQHEKADPLTTSPGLEKRHQVMLSMAPDDSSGNLAFKDGKLEIFWPALDKVQPNAAANWVDQQLQRAHGEGGFCGGLYLANPFWKPLPKAFDAVFEGASALGGTHLCNHPLGGCPMGNSGVKGVVNSRGQVFRTADEVHDSLYVLDGSILPAAPGVNPYMTISAVAHRLACLMDGEAQVPILQPLAYAPRIPVKAGRSVQWPVGPLSFVFNERLFGPQDEITAQQIDNLLQTGGALAMANSLVLDASVEFPDIELWLRDPSIELGARFVASRHKAPERVIDSIEDEDLEYLFEGRGSVRLLRRDDPGFFSTRTVNAIRRFLALRGDEIKDGSAGNGLGQFWRVARQHGFWRRLDYEFTGKFCGREVSLKGSKLLAYDGSRERHSRDEANPWVSLTSIDLRVDVKDSEFDVLARFRVDLARMAKNIRPLQHTGTVETPQVVNAVAGVASLFVRVMVQTHLWTFAAPTYARFPCYTQANAGRLRTPTEIVDCVGSDTSRFPVTVERPVKDGWRLLRALPKSAKSGAPVLLIHGLAHGSQVFWTDTVDRNMAGYLLAHGHEVWLLDHGLSTGLASADPAPDIDEVAVQIAAAIDFVHAKSGSATGIDVFSHCVGSAGTSIAVLGGKVTKGGKSKIRRLVMHAVPPWIQPAESNLLRAYIGVFFKDRFFPESFDPIPWDDGKPPETCGGPNPKQPVENLILDRFASSLAWNEADHELHSKADGDSQFGRTVCNRMTALYGYEWRHSNLDTRTHRNIASLVGPAGANAYRNLYFLLNRKRVTDSKGHNIYVRVPNFVKEWTFETLFLHGEDNKVFDAESSRLSAHLLTAIKKEKQLGQDPKVDLRIVPGYGHMDTLFGRNASTDVFQHVRKFFESGGANDLQQAPRSRMQASRTPVTGPIISRPTVDAHGNKVLRIWVESNEFQSAETMEIQFACPSAFGGYLPAKLRPSPLKTRTNKLEATTFWLYDVECSQATGPVDVRPKFDPPAVVSLPPKSSGSTRSTVASTLLTDGSRPLPWIGQSWDQGFVAIPPSGGDQEATSSLPEGARIMTWFRLPWFRRFIDAKPVDSLSFVAGSCLYPGSWFDQERADAVFRRVRGLVEQVPGIDHLLLMGDQIYADASMSLFDIADHRERYQESYRRAFNAPNLAWVLRHVPTYMAVDDHEFRDNEPGAILGGDLDNQLQNFDIAAAEAWNFQMHGASASHGRVQLWYDFTSNGFDFFVFDTRSERRRGSTISEDQRRDFVAWLKRASLGSRPVFVVTGSPLAPLPCDEALCPHRASTSDSLRAHPDFVRMVGEEVRAARLPFKPVWLSGDPHISSFCEVSLKEPNGTLLSEFACIVASGLNVPLPFANDAPDDFEWKRSSLRLPSVEVDVTAASLVSAGMSHAVLLDVEPTGERWTLNVSVVDATSSKSVLVASSTL